MHNTSRSPFPLVPGIAGGTLLAAGLLWSRHHAPPSVPVCVITGMDASVSVQQPLPGGATQLGRSRAALARLGTSLEAGLDFLVVARVDRQASEFYAQTPPEGYEKFLRLLLSRTQTPAAHDGTFPAAFWSLAATRAQDAQQSPGKAVEIAFYGDGDNDDLTPAAHIQITQAARQLAANPRVAGVWVFGAKPENWGTLRTLFSPLRGRFHLTPREELAPQPLLDDIDRIRRAP